MEKVFKNEGVCQCTGNVIDSPACRQCRYYYRAGIVGALFIVCANPEMAKQRANERANERANSKLAANKKIATRKPASTKKRAKGNAAQIKTDTVPKKRGRPKKAK